ncbi:MAG: hypothetical protein D8M57_07540 [Candidatus Scalindua sp. AMX11]|nr:MAG: hypothetical protein DWQ00_05790 [Candidatus Scalindua sp.]NOG82511.1 hypothetical protein [Planctomycetota bacterium]RZV93942.1 MAG: hypothetical protein EX341_03550 [Candidatus Scalindua sp. SCAELEC01]TDE65562.1 MAG: hypothetical protein D8M57_07540 [Candidatus Scalindua sp. AMX11]GJQ58145.1 MAG: hypothetical protein SCALA701_09460 [Candidatus Scalindua sp.]
MKITEIQQKLIEFINGLDTSIRHTIKIMCRGNEPWQIEEFNTISKIDLKPENHNGFMDI